MKPICLVIPPSVFLLDERVFMSLGILRVAAVLEQAGHTVEVLDLSGIENYEDVTRQHAASSTAEFFGITATTPQMPAAAKVAAAIRATRQDARLILGGPYITLVNAALKGERRAGRHGRAERAFQRAAELFDILVAGDGEEAIFKALAPGAPNFIDADDPSSPMFLDDKRLNHLPWPARHLVDVESYHYTIEGEQAMSMIAQLGCPFECGFCGGRESPMLRRVRMRSEENIVAEMTHLTKTWGAKGIMLYDDELNVNPRVVHLMEAIAAEQKKLGIQWKLRGFIKSQLFTDQQAAAMYAAGFRWILVGFESGSPRILQNINKHATLEENNRCMEIARRNGLKTKALMSIGHPGENEQTIRETKQWLLDVKPEDFDVALITTYPGSPYYDWALPVEGKEGISVYTYPKTGDRLYGIEVDYTKVADYFKGDPDGGYRAYVYTDHLTSERLVELRDEVERDVRKALNIPFNHSTAAVRYEHSMGITQLPPRILRTTKK